MLRSSLVDYSDAYILVKGNISVNKTPEAPAVPNNKNKKVIFKSRASFTDCVSKINNTQVDHAKDIDIVIPIYILTEYSDKHSKTSGSLLQFCKDILTTNNNGNIIEIDGANAAD